MKICIVLNGEIEDYKITRDIILKECYDCIICADGGANHTYKMDIIPDYILGDLDSVEEEKINFYINQGVKFEKFPSKKDETDTELCLFLAKTIKANHIDFFGALGGRIDHTLANIKLLYYLKEDGIYSRILSDKEEMYIVENEEFTLFGNKGDTISVIAVKGDAKGVTLTGLEYPLDDYYMKYSVPIGISNVMLGNSCKIKVEQGCVLVVRNL
ncbi:MULTISPECIES: thiamine diphosphokinase [unclassified Clostridioides]|uniref:thiamine diphosphokinase n=1 Tax=unclassified Clostridioides TaxID=2635829 RepID=UPI001D1169A5|nr:thiamine diphosphokinase [Clostridioides sp. ZZV14-6150]MCC0660061.1 thiamine diphosphokinase [Clostridioides sp. ZZV14-6154]MCC0667249.1 thiamine diphosphokinase [Clostridioides sp. ZZV14-6153]MCC0717255.1 thiamine diphosphokinase [Clostridioides sp. ZZV14-6105]MCC0721140.1 thiamine diphosphokinase [Clostridioides sp. ZZV14-6104]MCC0726893.1 thiamine diphosphokinase [Clostridioides sp. ZZV14-6045]MCC0730272.1 thiamine diphosphokinase [Clostridioides sp. ZZV14-6048]MCC0733150.1 thiamine d